MAQTSKLFDGVHDDLQARLNQLMRDVESVRAEWQGRGGVSFQSVTQEWKKDQDRMLLALSETSNAVLSSGQSYAATDTDASARMNSTYNLPL